MKFIFSISIFLIAGSLGSFFTAPKISTWYATLIKTFHCTTPSSEGINVVE
ncbi:MAG TPA: hypothetical protein VIO11_07840 [Candidatus Methanoperedens sp.]